MNALRAVSFVLWAGVGLSAAYWVLKAVGQGSAAPAHTQWVSPKAPARADLSRLWGADAPPAVEPSPQLAVQDSRYQLIGVVAARQNPEASVAVALLATEGKPAKAYRVGQTVGNGWVLQSVGVRSAELGPPGAPAAVRLELPALPPPATGVLPFPATTN